MSGKVITVSVSTAKHATVDEFWLITRAGPDVPGMTRHRELAPSTELFHRYLNQWKGQPPEEWWSLYTSAFSKELLTEEKLEALRVLYRKVKNGAVIGLVCYCSDGNCCHRRLVAKFLEEHGIEAEEVAVPPSPQLHFDLANS
jgi:uncharacterized protein YeaO (DUF488 family)